ncbi:MAG: DUF1566 domain-containing protein [Leptospiraceae bacterium]|nr:DUF1566 domain-containing protein [Leptospiraceae bacterium]
MKLNKFIGLSCIVCFVLVSLFNCKVDFKRSFIPFVSIAITLQSQGSSNASLGGTTGGTSPVSSSSKSITSFSFESSSTGLNKAYTGTISGTTINIEIPYGLGLTLVPSFTHTGKSITVGSTAQVSGTTSNLFSPNVTYRVTAEDGSTQDYTVIVYQIAPVADTGQTACFGTPHPQWVTPGSCSSFTAMFPYQDGELVDFPNAKGIQISSTNSGYPNDPINRDTLKGIVWKTCHEGQTGLTCSGGTASSVNHSTATTLCNNLNSANAGAGYAGLKNWRLPNVQELSQVIEMNGSANSTNYWNSTLFPNPPTPGNSIRWTSNVLLPAATNAMISNDYISNQIIGNNGLVHCISGPTSPSFDMVDNGDGTILDKRTKLIWQKCANGQTNSDCSGGAFNTTNWSNSLLACKNLVLAGKSWRLPNLNEMVTLLDLSLTTTIKVNNTLFPNITGGQFDNSTSALANLAYTAIFNVNFNRLEGISGKGVGNTYNSRCVAGP